MASFERTAQGEVETEEKKNQHTLETHPPTDRIIEYIDSAYSKGELTVFSCTRWLCRSWSWRGWCSPRLFLPVTKTQRESRSVKTKPATSLPDSDTLHISHCRRFFCFLTPVTVTVLGKRAQSVWWQHLARWCILRKLSATTLQFQQSEMSDRDTAVAERSLSRPVICRLCCPSAASLTCCMLQCCQCGKNTKLVLFYDFTILFILLPCKKDKKEQSKD